jgi:hypothetical protein
LWCTQRGKCLVIAQQIKGWEKEGGLIPHRWYRYECGLGWGCLNCAKSCCGECEQGCTQRGKCLVIAQQIKGWEKEGGLIPHRWYRYECGLSWGLFNCAKSCCGECEQGCTQRGKCLVIAQQIKRWEKEGGLIPHRWYRYECGLGWGLFNCAKSCCGECEQRCTQRGKCLVIAE